ncbi:MAG TPA: tape measure protein, partial [Dissulfurispiraceae bacterium]|nr:tape measure protein [Dissulfurispiraceae bacterium]
NAAMDRLKKSSGLVGNDLARATQQVRARMSELKAEMDGVEAKTGGLQGAFGKLVGVWAAFQGAMAAGGLIAAIEEMDRLDARLKISEGSAKAAALAMGEIKRIATETRAPVKEVADAYIRFSTAIQAAGGSQQEAIAFTENLTKALKVSGASTQQVGATMMQLGQAFQSGVLQGDEFRSVAENGGMVLNYLAKSLGVTRGQLRKMSQEGQLTSDVMLKMSDAADDINRDFAKIPRTASDAFTLVANAFLDVAQKSTALRLIIQGLGAALIFVAENLGAVVSTAILAGLAALVVSAGGVTAAFTAATVAVKGFSVALLGIARANPILLAVTAALMGVIWFWDEVKNAAYGFLELIGMKPKVAITEDLADELSQLEKQLDGMQAKLSTALDAVKKQIDDQRKAATASAKAITDSYAAMSGQIDTSAADQIRAIRARYDEERALIARAQGDSDARYAQELNALIIATKQQIEVLKDAARQKTQLIDDEYTIAAMATRVMYDNERDRARALQELDNAVMQKKRDVLAQIVSDYRQHIDTLNAETERNFQAVKAIEDQKRGLTQSTQERIRSLQQAAMGEYAAYQDKLKQIDELNAKARAAILEGQSEQAVEYAKKAQDVASGIASGVKENGKEIVSQANATATAISKITESESIAQAALDARKNAHQQVAQAAQQEAQSVESSMSGIATQLQTVNAQLKDGLSFTIQTNVDKVLADVQALEGFIQQREMLLTVQSNLDELQDQVADMKIELEEGTFSTHDIEDNAKEVQRAIDNLKKDTSSTHTIFVKKVQKNADGGLIQKFAAGGQAFRRAVGRISGPGTGTSDSIPSMLSNGEFVIRASMVRKWGAGFFEALNRGMMPPVPRYAMGGAVNVPLSMSGSSEALTVTFRAGDLEAPVKITDRTSRESMKAFARELQKIRLVQG